LIEPVLLLLVVIMGVCCVVRGFVFAAPPLIGCMSFIILTLFVGGRDFGLAVVDSEDGRRFIAPAFIMVDDVELEAM